MRKWSNFLTCTKSPISARSGTASKTQEGVRRAGEKGVNSTESYMRLTNQDGRGNPPPGLLHGFCWRDLQEGKEEIKREGQREKWLKTGTRRAAVSGGG